MLGEMSDAQPWITVLRSSHDGLRRLVEGLSPEQFDAPSACSDWTVAQVLSHLGSQAEIFTLIVEAGARRGSAPGPDQFQSIWDTWNAKTPEAQAHDSLAANEAFVSGVEGLDEASRAGFELDLFGAERDLTNVLGMRLHEHAVHSWDVAVAFDPSAEVASDAVALLVDELGHVAARAGRPSEAKKVVEVTTTTPARRFTLTTDGVRLEPDGDGPFDASIELPAASLLRLICGRVDDTHPARGPVRLEGVDLQELRGIFPGY